MAQQLAGDERKIACRGQRLFAFAVQSVGVDERRVRAAEFAGARVHPLDKGGFRARQMLRHCNRTVVRRADRNRLEHFIQRQLLARLQPDLRAAHRAGVLAAGYHRVQRHFAALERFHRQQHGHNFCHRRRLQLFVGVVDVKLLPVCRIQRRRFRVERAHFGQRRRLHRKQSAE